MCIYVDLMQPGASFVTLWVLEQARHATLGQNGSVFQQGPDEAACGQLTEQVCQELHKALAVQQLLLVPRSCQVCNFWLTFLHGFWVSRWGYLIQHLHRSVALQCHAVSVQADTGFCKCGRPVSLCDPTTSLRGQELPRPYRRCIQSMCVPLCILW